MAPLPSPVTPQQWAGVFLHGLDTVWRYRFFFTSIVEIAGRDEQLAGRLRALTGWIVDWTTAAIDALTEQGSMRPPASEDRRLPAEDVFIIIRNRTSFTVAFRGTAQPRAIDAREGVPHSMLLPMPHFEPEFAQRVRAAIDDVTDG